MRIDHVTIAGPDLRRLETAFAAQGMRFEFGGAHANGITHMSLLGLPDGSYIELISSMKPQERSPWWDAAIRGGAGPCAWCLGADDVAAEAKRIGDLGVTVRGPYAMQRTRPDGKVIEWDLAFLGDGEPGATLPFIIRDRTPRQWRVQPNSHFARGIDTVVLAVPDLDAATALFERVYGIFDPDRGDVDALDAEVAHYHDAPLALAMPRDANRGPLAQRLRDFGPSPCALLLQRPGRVDHRGHRWLDRPVQWLDENALLAARIGLVEG